MKPSAQKNIFIVEDNFIYSTLVEYQLRNRSTGVKVFKTGEDCLEHIHEKPDLVIVDYSLAGKLNGIETLERIKKINPETEVIIISGTRKASIVREALVGGAFDFIEKTDEAFGRIKDCVKFILKEKMASLEASFDKRFKLIGVSIGVIAIMAGFVLHYLNPSWLNI